MSPLTDTEVAEIAGEFEGELMPNVATVSGEVRTKDGQGGKTTALRARATDVPCGYGPLKQRGGDAEEPTGGTPTAQSRWLFRMPAGTDVRPTDVVTVDGDPLQYRVEILRSPRGSYSFMCRFEAIALGVGGAPEQE